MNSEERNSDNVFDYDDESFDNESSEDIASEEESTISEISGEGHLMEELLPDNSSIKSLIDSADSSSLEENNDKGSTVYSTEEEAHSQTENQESQVTKDIEANYIAEIEPTVLETLKTKVVSEDNQIVEGSSEDIKSTSVNSHEIDESESDVTKDIVDSIRSLAIQSDKNYESVVFEKEANDSESHNADGSCCDESEVELTVTSQTPTSFNSENHAFHMDITHKPTRSNASIPQRPRNSHRKSLSFSNERMREIERHNQILLRKILTQKPRKENINQKGPNSRMTTSAVNRKKQQRQIDLDNQVLKRKIEAIALRRPKIL